MSEKQKVTHAAYCDYQIAKAKLPLRKNHIVQKNNKVKGIKTHNMSRAMLAQTLASLF